MTHSTPFINKAACLSYLMSRQTPDGGFCYYRAYGVEESNGKDTYSAVAGLLSLQAPIPDLDKLLAWLHRLQNNQGGYSSFSMGWFALETLRLLNTEPLQNPDTFLKTEHDRFLSLDWRVRTIEWSSLLLRLSRLSTLMHQWEFMSSPEFRCEISILIDFLQGNHGGYGNPVENLLDTYRAAIIVDCLTLEQPAGMLEFMELCSDEVFGFRLVPAGSANSLAAVHAGIGLFHLCGAVMPRERIATIWNYIASCQTMTGGFGRTPGAIATLADTWLALDCLQHLPEDQTAIHLV
ncbi:prenyltransferase/squalene oxidase repeat-containing protein [Methylobacter tundripaludum]|uniref:prenyltransferase/squalene oxidase repeat-containing protein n=1 Tax=Methylobacter tundripaludum TaxID=173365 RepID=UPI0004DFA884|nr:prenyltransferase/squalene oxidase repeat-containing protein [Methylobacter tundripaludum]